MHTDRGFTLIELLVVIAIIGILSSTVLASLNSARLKGADAAIKSDMDAIRKQAEVYLLVNGSYSPGGASGTSCLGTDCVTGAVSGQLLADPVIQKALDHIAGYNNAAPNTNIVATVIPDAYGIAVMMATPNTYWCMDSTGVSRGTTLSGSAYGALTNGRTSAINAFSNGLACN